MAGRGPPPKPSALRQRRNKTSTNASLPSAEEAAANEVPDLFPRDDGMPWHPMVIEWWESVWRSPMASEYLDADMKGGLYLLADLHQARWHAESRSGLIEASREIRLQEVRFGLSPVDRRRLQWEVARGEEAERKRRSPAPKAVSKEVGGDPRSALKAI